MTYQREYHRSTYSRNEAFEGIVFLFVPFLVLFFLYCAILFVIIKNKIRLTRLLVTTSAIILTGVMVTVPEIVLATFYVEMPYEVAQVGEWWHKWGIFQYRHGPQVISYVRRVKNPFSI